MDPLKAATILEDAADLLLIHGRCTGSGRKPDGRLCVVGAIQVAQGDEPTGIARHPDAVNELERHLYEFVPFAAEYIAACRTTTFVEMCDRNLRFPAWIWNDRQRGADDDFEIIDTLRLCAKNLRNEAD